MSLWPLLTLWSSLAGLHWNVRSARIFLLGITLIAVLSIASERRLWRLLFRGASLASPWLLAFAVLSAATIWTRWMQAKDLAFPPWVDAVHHTMIVRLILDHGSVPKSLSPYIQGGVLYYHWGFHALAAWTAWIVGVRRDIDLPPFILSFGQFLNSLTLLMIYAAARLLLRSKWAALVAGGLAMLVSYFPAYYLSWGRYTHLTGMLLLPPLLIALWQSGMKPNWRSMALVILLACGLVLVHVRIAFLAAVFAIELAAVLVSRRCWRALTAWVFAGAASLAAISPWLIRVGRDPYARAFITSPAMSQGGSTQSFPMDILWAPHNRELFAIATCGISGIAGWFGLPLLGRVASAGWWLLCVWLALRRPIVGINPWRPLGLLAVYCGILALLLGYVRWPIDLTRFASVSSATMSVFLPLCIATAAIALWVGQQTFGRARTVAITLSLLLGTVVSGVISLQHVVNPETVIADKDDERALIWIEEHTPSSARFAVAGHPWMGGAWVGSDGGYWISVATNRRSTLPPLLYAWTLPAERIKKIDRLLYDSNGADSLADPGVLRELKTAAVTNLYIGSRGDPDRLRALLSSGHATIVHREGAAAVLQISW